MTVRSDDIVYLSVKQAMTPVDGQVLTKRWWAYDPAKGIMSIKFHTDGMLHHAPQCNKDKDVAEALTANLYPGCKVKYIEVVFVEQFNKVAV